MGIQETMYLAAALLSPLVSSAAAAAAFLAPSTAAAFLALLSAPSVLPLSRPPGAPAAAARPIDEIVLKVNKPHQGLSLC